MRSSSGSATTRPSSLAHGREVAHLGDGEEALVGGVGAAGAAQEVDVLGRGQTLEVELGQPPQAQPLGHLRVQPAQRLVLDERAAVVARGT